MIKVLIFDFDDTLVKTRSTKWHAIRETGKRFYNIHISDSQLEKFWGEPYPEMLSGVFNHIDSFANLTKHYEETTKKFPIQPYDHAVATVKKLLTHYDVGILTSSTKKLVLDDLKILDFPIKKFSFIQTADDTKKHKPHPEVFTTILQLLNTKGINKNELLYIGDSLIDYQAAKAANITFLGMAHEKTTARLFEKKNIATASSFSNLLSLLS